MLYDALVVGAGIAGAAFARALSGTGKNFLILEQATELLEVGAGLSLWPNGQDAAEALGVDIENDLGGVPWTSLAYWSGNRRFTKFDTRTFDHQQRAPLILHRRDLHCALLNGIERARFALGARISKVEKVGDVWTVGTVEGREFRTRFLIAADGWQSLVRKSVLPSDPVRLTNYLCVRATIQRQLPFPVGEGGEIFTRNGVRFGYFRFAEEGNYWFAFLPRKLLADRTIQDVMRESSKENSICEVLVEATPLEKQIVSDIGDMKPVKSVGSSGLVLLGDAVHPMQPSFGQGAALALEDASCLADLLRSSLSEAEISATYLKRRRRRWKRMYVTNRYVGLTQQNSFAAVRALSLLNLRMAPRSFFAHQVRRLFRNSV